MHLPPDKQLTIKKCNHYSGIMRDSFLHRCSIIIIIIIIKKKVGNARLGESD